MSYIADKTFENVKAQVGSSVSAQTISDTLVAVEGTSAPFEFYPSVSCTSVLDGS